MMEPSVLVRATVVLAGALLIGRLSRRAPAAMRHLLFAAAFLILLLLPMAPSLVPAVNIEVPLGQLSPPAEPPPSATLRLAPLAQGPGPGPQLTPAHRATSMSDVLAAIWLLGVAVSLLPVAVGVVQLRRLRRKALLWPTGQQIVDALAAERGIRRRVQVLLNDAVAGPLTCSAINPAVILPADAATWDRDTVRRAFVHELEHVRRWDWIINSVARVLCTVYWFHPLVWIAWRHLTLEAERACDDAVVARDDPSAYASLLVSVAERDVLKRQRLLAMANRGDLARRVAAILDRTQVRGRAGRWSRIAALSAAGALAIGVSSMRVTGAQAPPTTGSNLIVTVLDPLGQPAAGVPLCLKTDHSRHRSSREATRIPLGDITFACRLAATC